DKNGKVIGQMTNKPADEPQKDTGNWTVKADGTVCATWDHWNSNKPICVALYKLTNGLLLVNEESKKFESLILKDDIKSGNQMN
ncbi:MAG TPA: hypothetical protein VHZ76_00215, partial [Gammaproteobacteria bacterium]|nr:hypothetical protein [Gammaproteobacteria bacterium]